jgi:hypothetical protein
MRRHYTKEDIEMVEGHMERCITWLATREIQIKSMLRHHYTATRVDKIKKQVSVDMKKLDVSYISW